MDTQKRRFLAYELRLLSLKAALSTRSKDWPIYGDSTSLYQRLTAQKAFHAVFEEIEKAYMRGGVTEQAHNDRIVEISNRLSSQLKSKLLNERFRIGISQKLINVHLKYLWAAGLCPEPPHCPIDRSIRDSSWARLRLDLERLDSGI